MTSSDVDAAPFPHAGQQPIPHAAPIRFEAPQLRASEYEAVVNRAKIALFLRFDHRELADQAGVEEPANRAVQCPRAHQQVVGASIAPLDLQVKLWQCSTMLPSGDARLELLSGTLELIVLRTLTVMGSQHAYGIAARIEQVAEQAIRLNQGTLYPALVRLEQKGWIKGAWQTTENNREAKYYTITRSGVRALAEQAAWWQRSAGLVNRLLTSEAE